VEDCLPRTVAGIWLRGLICVVPKNGGGDRSGRYCVGNFAIDMYSTLLQRRQARFGKICWTSMFLKHHTIVRVGYVECSTDVCIVL